MKEIEIEYNFSNAGSRNDVRMRVVQKFSEEKSGTGSGDYASRYIYYVETLENGDRVYLKRPANLHNGFDFLVCVENMNYAQEGEKVRNNPKHTDLEKDLLMKKEKQPEEYKKLYGLLLKVFECEDVLEEEMKSLNFESGFSVDHILKTMKWLFIEQDIRYWNYSGRNMTWSIVPKIK